MAFSGIPVIQKVTDNCFRITGVRLANGASGEIAFTDSTTPRQVELEAPNWDPYTFEGNAIGLQDMVKASYVAVDGGDNSRLRIVKTGTTHQNFLITFTNGAANDSSLLDIFIQKVA